MTYAEELRKQLKEDARIEYEKVHDSALKEYEKICVPAWKEYYKKIEELR